MEKDRNLAIPTRGGEEEKIKAEPEAQTQPQSISKEESEYTEKVFFEEDESVKLRDGVTYKIPPLTLKSANKLMKKLNTIDTGIIISNLMADEKGYNSYNDLIEVLLMAFKPYYKEMTVKYLEDHVDLVTAKEIIDIMIGLNGIKKSL